jgi:hypothetical protein
MPDSEPPRSLADALAEARVQRLLSDLSADGRSRFDSFLDEERSRGTQPGEAQPPWRALDRTLELAKREDLESNTEANSR